MGILPLRFAHPAKIRGSATTPVTDLVHQVLLLKSPPPMMFDLILNVMNGFSAKIGSIVPPGRGYFPPNPGTSCLATIGLSLRDKIAIRNPKSAIYLGVRASTIRLALNSWIIS